MYGHVRGRGRRTFLLGVVVFGLLFGLVAMHHLSIATGEAPVAVAVSMDMPDAAPPTAPDGPGHDESGHDSGLFHLCLAILTAVAVLVVSAVMWFRPRAVSVCPRSGGSWLRTAPRAPPPTAPVRLALLCVLRT